MIAWESVRAAVAGLAANRLRTLLTMGGIYIGVTAVVLVMAIGESARGVVDRQLDALGADSVQVVPSAGAERNGTGRAGRLTRADLAALREPGGVDAARTIVPTVDVAATLTAGARTTRPMIFSGTEPGYLDIYNRAVASGVPFGTDDVLGRRRVLVVGPTVARDLFGTEPAVGRVVRVEGAVFEVIGVLESKGSTFGFDNDDLVLAPITAAVDALGGDLDRLSGIAAAPADGRSSTEVAAQLRRVLDRTHRIADGAPRDYEVFDAAAFAASTNRIAGVLAAVLGGIAAISLVVGGVGVMNIMLVTVTERTREIGLRKALGGRRRHIAGQFLAEAALLTTVAGVGACLTVLALSRLEVQGVGLVVRPPAVALAVGISLGVGVFFGWFPARRAARLRPIDALRYE